MNVIVKDGENTLVALERESRRRKIGPVTTDNARIDVRTAKLNTDNSAAIAKNTSL